MGGSKGGWRSEGQPSRLSECVQCWEARELPPGWDDELPKVLSRIRSAEKKRQEKAAVVAGA